MTWPTAAVATTNLDQGTDEPRLARVELKQAVDNVNAIATEFGNVAITSPMEGQALVRSGNVWINANVATSGTSIGTGTQYLQMDTMLFNTVPTSSYAQLDTTFTELHAGAAGVTTSGNALVFGSGTYLIEMDSQIYFPSGSNTSAVYRVQLYNNTDATSIAAYDTERTGSISGPIYYSVMRLGTVKLVLTGTKTLIFRHYVDQIITANSEWEGGLIRITKIA